MLLEKFSVVAGILQQSNEADDKENFGGEADVLNDILTKVITSCVHSNYIRPLILN